jgi:signal transduction histidine kinase
MGWILAAHLAAPLRRLRRLVDQFGRGDLSTRALSTRKDEIGELSRSFDEMAGRIETLLSAERRLLQDVSHELRSPLTRLDVAVDLASTSDDPGEFLGRIKRDIGRLSVLVNELLQLTRAEGDPTAHNLEPVQLDLLLEGLFEDCEVEAWAKGCRIERESMPPLEIMGEPELLRRAFENVVRNAVRHAPKGTTVEIGLDSAGDAARISVRDHGPGVARDDLRAVLSSRTGSQQGQWRYRAGTGHRAPRRRPAPRPDLRPQCSARAGREHRASHGRSFGRLCVIGFTQWPRKAAPPLARRNWAWKRAASTI